MEMLSRLQAAAFGARYGNDLVNVCATLTAQSKELRRQNAELRESNLQLSRTCLGILEGLIREMEDPGGIDLEMILAATRDWADQIARMEEHCV
jgi:hypothetical protein